MSADLIRPGRSGPFVAAYLASLTSPASKVTMARSLDQVAAVVADLAGVELSLFEVPRDQVCWHELTFLSAVPVREALVGRWAPATVNRHLAAIRGVVKVARLSGRMHPAVADAVATALKSVPRQQNPNVSRVVSAGEIRTVFDDLASRDGVVARRDAAMLALLTGCGLRRSELAAADLADLQQEQLVIRHGKGGKTRAVYPTGAVGSAVADWLKVRGDQPGPLLLTFGRGHDQGRMTGHGIWKRVMEIFERAGVPQIAPHDCRRWMITELLSAGQDVIAVRDLAGHASVSTTALYDRRGAEAARRAARHVHVPYVPPAG